MGGQRRGAPALEWPDTPPWLLLRVTRSGQARTTGRSTHETRISSIHFRVID